VLNQVRSTSVALEEKGGWVSLEIRKVVSDWFKYPVENLGLAVQAVDASGNSLITTQADDIDGSLVSLFTFDLKCYENCNFGCEECGV
jgi:hypothetical protein